MIVLSTAPLKTVDDISSMEALTSDPDSVEVLSSTADNVNPLDEQTKTKALKEVLAEKANNLSADALALLLKKPWDPFSPVVHHTRLKKLSSDPIFLYISNVSSSSTTPATARRIKNFSSMLAVLGKVSRAKIFTDLQIFPLLICRR